MNRVPFDISEENLEDFEKELIKVNDTMEFPFDDIKVGMCLSFDGSRLLDYNFAYL